MRLAPPAPYAWLPTPDLTMISSPSTTPRGRRRDPELAQRRRDEILRGAIPHFAREGFDGADVDAIAAGLGCAKGTIYNYFKNKKDLFHHCVDFVMRGLLDAIDSAERTDSIEDVERAIRAYLTYFHDHPQYVELLILERAVFRDRRKATYFDYRDVQIERWRALYERLMKAGVVRKMPVSRILDTVGDLLYGTIFTNYFAGRDKPLEGQIADVLDILLHGVLTPSEARRRARKSRT